MTSSKFCAYEIKPNPRYIQNASWGLPSLGLFRKHIQRFSAMPFAPAGSGERLSRHAHL
jgi:hypothetical protein